MIMHLLKIISLIGLMPSLLAIYFADNYYLVIGYVIVLLLTILINDDGEI